MSFGLPGWAYRPGGGRDPDRAPLEAAKATVPPRYRERVPAADPAVSYGVALYEAGFFWEAHEVWEAVWKAAPQNGRDRTALRGVIQLANAALKLRMNRPTAALRLLGEVSAALADLAASSRGRETQAFADSLPLDGLSAAVRDLSQSVVAGDDPAELALPPLTEIHARKCMSAR